MSQITLLCLCDFGSKEKSLVKKKRSDPGRMQGGSVVRLVVRQFCAAQPLSKAVLMRE